MLKYEAIVARISPWASNVVLVKKKDGTLHKRNGYPLPCVDPCLDSVSESGWFSTVDLRSSYHQVFVAAEDSEKAAFICHRGKFRTCHAAYATLAPRCSA